MRLTLNVIVNVFTKYIVKSSRHHMFIIIGCMNYFSVLCNAANGCTMVMLDNRTLIHIVLQWTDSGCSERTRYPGLQSSQTTRSVGRGRTMTCHQNRKDANAATEADRYQPSILYLSAATSALTVKHMHQKCHINICEPVVCFAALRLRRQLYPSTGPVFAGVEPETGARGREEQSSDGGSAGSGNRAPRAQAVAE